MIKVLFAIGIAIGVLGFNVILQLSNEAVNFNSTASASGWTKICKYYAPVRIIDIEVDSGKSCPQRISLR